MRGWVERRSWEGDTRWEGRWDRKRGEKTYHRGLCVPLGVVRRGTGKEEVEPPLSFKRAHFLTFKGRATNQTCVRRRQSLSPALSHSRQKHSPPWEFMPGLYAWDKEPWGDLPGPAAPSQTSHGDGWAAQGEIKAPMWRIGRLLGCSSPSSLQSWAWVRDIWRLVCSPP